MHKKIGYLMARDTRVIMDDLTKVIIDEDTVGITYTVIRKNLDDLIIPAIKYYESEKTMIIYNKLKKYNNNVYNSFIKWAEENEIKYMKIEGI